MHMNNTDSVIFLLWIYHLLGADVASEIRDGPDVVDLLISFTYAAARGDIRRFNPFPVGLEVKYLDEEKKERVNNFLHSNVSQGQETRNAQAVVC